MNCENFQKLATAYVEGTLDVSQFDEMAAHEADCHSCSCSVETLRMVMTALDTAEPVAAPRGFADRIRARIDKDSEVVAFPAREPVAAIREPLTCEEFGERIAAFVDGELTGDFLITMAGHRAACAACDRVASAHESVVMALETAPVIAAPAGFADRVRAAVAFEEAAVPLKARAFRLRPLDLLVAAAVSVSMIAGVLLLVTSSGETSSTANGLMTVFETVLARLIGFPQLIIAWVAGTISPEQWIWISRFLAPIEIPYLPFQFSALVYAAATLTALISTAVARKLGNDSTPYTILNR